jgi:hypothetical protein
MLELVQIDLVDYGRHPDRGYSYVLYIKDFFSKFTFLYVCVDKTAVAVQQHFEYWRGYFGVPKVVQLDNGREFCSVLIELLMNKGIRIARSWPKYPQSQGHVKHSNTVFKKRLATWCKLNHSTKFIRKLPHIVISMNKRQHTSLPNHMCPYEVMFC